jgi:hypothetical protein
MWKQLLLPLAGVAVFIVIVGLLVQGKINFGIPKETPMAKSSIEIAGEKIFIDIADSDEERAIGLSGKTSLPENEGMLFVFDEVNVRPSFWMKGMLIPLDIIWIDDGKITKIDRNVENPESDTPDSELSSYRTTSPVDYVLEVNAGFSDKFDLKVGDSAKGDSIKN